MSIRFKVKGLESLTKMATLSTAIQSVLTVSWHQVGRKIETYIKRQMSVTSLSERGTSSPGAFPAVQSGTLQASISYQVTGWDSVTIRGEAPYAGYLEFGTRNSGARPFIQPGIENQIDFVEKTITTNLRRAFRV